MHELAEPLLNLAALFQAVFGITLLMILRVARTENYEYVASQAEMNTVFWPRIKLKASWGFFIWAYKEYIRIKKSKAVVLVNLSCLCLAMIGFLVGLCLSFLE